MTPGELLFSAAPDTGVCACALSARVIQAVSRASSAASKTRWITPGDGQSALDAEQAFYIMDLMIRGSSFRLSALNSRKGNGRGDDMGKRRVVAVYSPMCAYNAAFAGAVRRWALQAQVELQLVPYHSITEPIRRWYRDAGVLDERGLRRTVFIDVFVDGKLVSDSAPPDRDAIAKELGTSLSAEPADSTEPPKTTSVNLHADVESGKIRPVAITADTYLREMELCVDYHPGGRVAEEFRADCLELKEPVFLKTFAKQEVAGLFLERDDEILGLVEVHPREVLREYGFATGRTGEDREHLTVGCYEVAGGMPRLDILDVLMSSVLDMTEFLDRPFLEGVGRIEWPEGFNPYWVYDRYGFRRTEELRPGWYVMTKQIHD